MFFRLAEILIILVALVGGAWWLFWTFVGKPNQLASDANAKIDRNATEKAKVDYKEIRQTWIDLSVNSGSDEMAMLMEDMSIPEVAAFQKMMVATNQKYGDLKDNVEVDSVFVQKSVALRELFNAAILSTKKKKFL